MAKSTTTYVCQECGTIHGKWAGQCEGCNAWNTLIEEQTQETPKGLKGNKKGASLAFASLDDVPQDLLRHLSGLSELDRVLGGGLVPGSGILIGGDPGIGKSTLLLQMTASLGKAGIACSYISGEESVAQIQMRAKRLGLHTPNVQLATANSVRDIFSSIDNANAPEVVIIDSIQTMFIDSIESAPGTVTQVRASSNELIKLAKKRHIAMLLVGHVTKDGQIAGPRVLEHMVDTVLYFEGDRGHPFRILRAVKNRFGATDEIGVFSMTDKGLAEVENPSALFLSQRAEPVSGSVVFAGMEGSRPMLVEIQALVAPSPLATPRRAVVGWDSNRLSMILAVLEARCGITFSNKEVYLNVAGGLRINEPAADLAAVAALLSAINDIPFAEDAVVFGEVGLSGEVRPVSRMDARLKEAEKLGFHHAYFPGQSKQYAEESNMPLGSSPIHHVQDMISMVRQPAYEKVSA